MKLAHLLMRSPWRRALLRHRIAAAVEHQPLASLVQPVTVIDVGANKGQFALWASAVWPGARIVSFEPLAGPAARFRAVLSRLELHEVALGERDGTATIHISAREDSSSLLPIGAGQVAAFAGTHEVGTTEVTVRRLDQMLTGLAQPALLKIDVQGFELSTLLGAEAVLPLIRWVYVECSERELYRGQALRHEVTAWLAERNYAETASIGEAGSLQADVLFTRRAGPHALAPAPS